ncbi:hypothetical protein B0H14DRAFT_2621458 [Mycena olivaceomarginata]|nr:hypothetical protein B0H14DRAFT_2621458 [Mycena olivaceomarginata]
MRVPPFRKGAAAQEAAVRTSGSAFGATGTPATVLTETGTAGRKPVAGERIGHTLARNQRFTSVGWETIRTTLEPQVPEVPARYKLMKQNFDLRPGIGLTPESPHLRYVHKKMPARNRRLVGGKHRREGTYALAILQKSATLLVETEAYISAGLPKRFPGSAAQYAFALSEAKMASSKHNHWCHDEVSLRVGVADSRQTRKQEAKPRQFRVESSTISATAGNR